MTDALSLKQARKLVLHSQGLPPRVIKGTALAATQRALDKLGYVQIDTISVVERAHHHTLWNRNPRYQPQHLSQLLGDKAIFEYWSHAAAYLPSNHYRYTLPRKQAIKSGQADHWYPRNAKIMAEVLSRIKQEGPLMAKDFDKGATQTGVWESKPAKQALEYLFMQGDLMIPKRIGFHKVYDLTERVLSSDADTSCPSKHEYYRFLITQFLKANGLGQESEMVYLLKNMLGELRPTLNSLREEGVIKIVTVGSQSYFALTANLSLLEKPLNRSRLKILSPFDNLLIQRKRMQHLFEFDYQIECYIPAAKRRYGYFCLPLLWGGDLVGRMDCKADRKTNTLYLLNLFTEKPIKDRAQFTKAFAKEMLTWMQLNACSKLVTTKKTASSLDRKHLQGIIDESLA